MLTDLLLIDDSDCDMIHQVLAVEFKRTCCSVGSEIVYIFWMNWKLPKDLLVYSEFEQVQSVSFVRNTCPVPSSNLHRYLILLESMWVENFWKFKSN
jgi:hypothetical protein